MYYASKLVNNSYVDERRDPIKSTEAAAKYLARLYLTYAKILDNVNNLEKIVGSLEKDVKHNNELLSKCIVIEKSSKPDINNSLLQLINKYADHMNNQKPNSQIFSYHFVKS